MSLDELKELAGHRELSPWIIKLVFDAIEKELENNFEGELDEDEDDVVNYILIEEDSHGVLTWDSSYETLDEFFEVLNIVAEESQQPVVVAFPLH